MKKLVIIFAMLGLMFNVIGCKAKKAQDETEIVENADVEKIEAEDANFAGNESTVETGPVDESLQAALGETPLTDVTAAGALPEDAMPSTDVVNTEPSVNTEIAAAPTLDEKTLGSDITASTDAAAAGLTETPIIEAPPVDIARNEPPVDPSLSPDTQMSSAVTEMNETAALTETPIIETPTEVSSNIETPVAAAEVKEASVKPAASSNALKKISETVPYKQGEGFVNTVYIARPKEKLADISRTIYGMDKSKELKSINGFLKSRSPKGGDKVYYISPNRPTDSSRTITFYEDTGMMASNYVAAKGENLHKVSKKLLGYDNAWKEVWTTNEISSKTKLAAGDSIRYWRAADQIQTSPTLAQNDGPAKIVDSPNQMPEQMPPTKEVAMNTPPPQEMAPHQPQAQELPPPPDINQQVVQQELPSPPPPPPPQELAAAPVAPVKQHNMEEEPAVEEGAMHSDTTMMIGVVAVLVAALALVLVRRNKKKKEADLASIEQNHVGT
ncbi:MAG: hypothetical protein H7235_04830 [Bdellovibrionaceae bacterium]|nr:hypothetical protein [Pseudobdellovibrionaceae bacterium]